MHADSNRVGEGAVLAVVTLALCCGGALLILVADAIVAAIGGAPLGIGAALVVLATVTSLLLFRHQRRTGHDSATRDRRNERNA